MLIKADKDQFQKIQMDLKRFALYDDFKDLYNKTMKPMQKFQDQMHEYSQEHREVKAAVRSLDESLMGKANKTDFFDVRNQLEKKMSYEDGKKFDEAQQEKIDAFQDEIWNLEKQLKIL